ncbi:MAG: hypothetical protein IPH31_23590 [Lewinellaceae bacterium]|nr:hypothetical protein [Lewinellaceae bacterium]
MPIEINQLTVTARVREELRDTACGDNPNATNQNRNGRRGQNPASQRTATRQAAEAASQMIRRQKER